MAVAALWGIAALVAIAMILWLLDRRSPDGPGPQAYPNDSVTGELLRSRPLEVPNPVDARVSAQPDGGGGRFAVTVVGFAGRAIVGCGVLGWSDAEQRMVSQPTDELGVARFVSREGSGVVAAVHESGRWAMARVPWTGEHKLALGGAAVVAGNAFVDGAPAPAGLQLRLSAGEVEFPFEVPAALTQKLRDRLATSRSLATTRAGGAFVFQGLPSDWRGVLLPPSTHWLVPTSGEGWQPRKRRLLAPGANLVVSLTRLPAVVGRVLWDDDGAPAAFANVQAIVEHSNGSKSLGRGVSSQDGSFSLPLTPTRGNLQARWAKAGERPSAMRTKVTCWNVPGSLEDAVLEASGADLRPFTIRLQRAPRIHFLVRDQQGGAVVGARVNIAGSSTTDRLGRGYFRGRLRGRRTLLAGASGYAVAPVKGASGDGSLEAPLVFVLLPANWLHIRVEGLQANGVLHEVRIESAVRVLAGQRRWSAFDREFGGSQCSTGASRRPVAGGFERVETLTPTLDDRGNALLHSLEPDVECVLKVRDRMGHALAQTSFRTPGFGSKSDVVVALERDKKPRRIRGDVVSARGLALANADVTLVAGARRLRVTTNHDGAFEFAAVYTEDPVDLRVRASGYAGVRLTGLVPSDDAKRHEIRLGPGFAVTVRVSDRTGAPADLFAKPRGFEDQEAQAMGDGAYRWQGLPQSVEFYVELQGREFSVMHDAARPEATLQVPLLGSVSAPTSAFPVTRGWSCADCLVELRSVDHADLRVIRFGFGDGSADRQWVFPGRYSASLFVRRAGKDGVRAFVATGVTAEVSAVPGKHAAVKFE